MNNLHVLSFVVLDLSFGKEQNVIDSDRTRIKTPYFFVFDDFIQNFWPHTLFVVVWNEVFNFPSITICPNGEVFQRTEKVYRAGVFLGLLTHGKYLKNNASVIFHDFNNQHSLERSERL